MSSILAKLEILGLELQDYRIRNEKLQREREEKVRIEKDIKDRKDKEFIRLMEFFLQAHLLHQANILREYVRTVVSNVEKECKNTGELENWVELAMNKIAWIDPLINQEDSVLDDSYKKNAYKEIMGYER